jgi:hypothetical protein
MTTPELMRYADLLDLSDQQRLALEPMHDRYMESFRRLRDGDIQEFQDTVLNMGMTFVRGGFQIPPREELEKVISQTETVIGKIEAVDRSFFNELATILSESQQLKLPRVRTARTLALYKNVAMEAGGEFNRGASVNMTEMVLELELSPERMQGIEPVLASYDGGLLNRTRGVYNALKDAAKYILDSIDELGLREMTPDKLMALGQDEEFLASMQVRFDEGSKPFQDAVYQLSQLNVRTYRSLMPLLEAESAATLRDRFYRAAYGQVYSGPGEWRVRYDSALKLKDLTLEMREQITLQRDNYARQEDQIHDQLVGEFDDSQRYRTFAILSEQVDDPHEAKIDELRGRLTALDDSADASLLALIGENRAGAIGDGEQRVEAEVTETAVVVQAGGGGADGARSEVRVVGRGSIGEIELPIALGVKDAKQITALLELAGDQQPVFDTLYDGYRSEFEQARNAEAPNDEDAVHQDGAERSADGTAGESEADEQESPAMRVKARLKALVAIDDAFFDDVALIVESDQQRAILQRLRGMRARAVLGETSKNLSSAWGVTFGDEESYLDVVRIAAESNIQQGEFAGLAQLWSEYEARSQSICEERFELAVAQRRRFDAYMKAASAGQDAAAAAGTLHQKWREKREAFRKANREIGQLNREFIDRVASQLPAEAAWDLRFAFHRQAYPDLFQDSERIEEYFNTALTLDTLSAEQRNRIGQITSDFRERYFALSSSMIELRQKRDFDIGSFEMPDKSMIEREITLQRLEFDRDEVAARAEVRLRMALSSTQLESIPGLRQ